jgi:hypothetical protein
MNPHTWLPEISEQVGMLAAARKELADLVAKAAGQRDGFAN